ncbi:unnamed protein product [Ceratitis capitata]|uniref:carboxylesterase n=1 Tax=Ceratitis capitata TaxID=7213 RepID=A0A811UEU0_CERCA|nr:unnamed protein product [Ceratitis capitata]
MGSVILKLVHQPVISTTHGKLRWHPYAKPPLGELRFKSPQPPEPWVDVRDCTKCPPMHTSNRYTGVIEGSEDCLYLSLYAKKLHSEALLPVIVYLIGGRFTTGDPSRSTWGPDYIMMKDVIFISIGFRMGALGFLSFADPELQVPGNAGLKDIYWHYNGSGAAQILMHLPQCKTLFHKVILMSGTQMHIRKIPKVEYRFAKHLGYNAERLCDLQIFTPEELEEGHLFVFSLVIEDERVPDAVITKDPLILFANKQAWCNGIPIIMAEIPLKYLISHEIRDKCSLSQQQMLARKIINLHLGANELCAKHVFDVLRLCSYDFIYHPIHRYLRYRMASASASTYLYRFDYDSLNFNLYRIKHCGREVRGVSHVDELSYIFYTPDSFKLTQDQKSFRLLST